MKFLFQKRKAKNVLTSVLLISFLVVPLGLGFKAKEAHAQYPVNVVGGTGTIWQSISAKANTVTSNIEATLLNKELTFDKIAYGLANIAIKYMSRSIIQWINSGFEGSPSFVTDLNGFLLDIADEEAGAFIENIGLGSMCSPFKLDVQQALKIQYQQSREYEPQCKLTDVVDNVDDFLNGNFAAGGWDGWFDLTTKPGNNPYGAFLLADEALRVRIRNKQGEKLEEYRVGSGFLSYEECETVATREICHITTPGTVIEEQLNNTLDSGRERLVMADEINEIIGALFAQLVTQAFSGSGGLLGLSSNGYSGGSGTSYLDAATSIESEHYGFEDTSNNPINNSLRVERDYLALENSIVAAIDRAEVDLNESCNAGTLNFPQSLSDTRSETLKRIDTLETRIQVLEILDIRYQNTDDAEEEARVHNQYLALASNEPYHTDIDVFTYERTASNIISSARNFEQTVDEECPQQQNNSGNAGTTGANEIMGR